MLRKAPEQFKEHPASLCELKTNTTQKSSIYCRTYEFWVWILLQLKCVNPAILPLQWPQIWPCWLFKTSVSRHKAEEVMRTGCTKELNKLEEGSGGHC